MSALSDRTRQRIVKVLLNGTRGVNDIVETLHVPQCNVSKHLRTLREVGIVDVRPIGTKREYSICDKVRERGVKDSHVLDFGAFRINFDALPD